MLLNVQPPKRSFQSRSTPELTRLIKGVFNSRSQKCLELKWELGWCYYCRKSFKTMKRASLILSQTIPGFYVSAVQVFENTAGKGEIARNEQFLLSQQCFLPFLRTLCYSHKIQNCCLQTLSVWRSLKFVIWERVKTHYL